MCGRIQCCVMNTIALIFQKGPVNDWTTENLTKQLQDKQNHLQQLEDENSNLRALSRSLMKVQPEKSTSGCGISCATPQCDL
jgi:hypothetical protein